jgi:hypothetical protein
MNSNCMAMAFLIPWGLVRPLADELLWFSFDSYHLAINLFVPFWYRQIYGVPVQQWYTLLREYTLQVMDHSSHTADKVFSPMAVFEIPSANHSFPL